MSEQNQKNPENRGENREYHGNRNSNGYRGNHRHSKNYNREKRTENASSGKENIAQRESGRNIADDPVKRSIQAQNNAAGSSESKQSFNNADAAQNGNIKKHKHSHQRNFSRDNRSRAQSSVKVEETREDIIRDIGRIEKEIELEIKEISALQFGM